MAGTRILGEFKSYAGTEYTIYVYDAEFVASANTFPNVIGDPATGNVWGDPTSGNVWGWDALDELENPPGIQTHKVGLPGFALQYETENEKIWTPLLPSRLTFTLYIENATQETLLNSLANSHEGQYLVRVLKNGELFWCGVLLYDVVQWDDAAFPYPITLTAVDGLSRLKNIDYPNTSASGGERETLLEIVYNCMGQLETNGFFAAGDNYLIDNVDWWESRHVASQAVDPLALTRVNNGTFRRLINSAITEYEYTSCYDVLWNICQAFGARMFFANGTWWIQQVDQYEGGAQYRRRYRKNGTLLGFSTVSYDILCDQRKIARTNGRYEYLPPINKAEINYEYWNAFNFASGATWSAVMPQSGSNGSNPYDLGEIDSNDGVSVLNFRCSLDHRSDFNTLPFVPVKHKFEVEIKVGAYYLSRPSTYNSFTDIEYGVAEWTLTPATVEVWTQVVPTQDNELCQESTTWTGINYSGIYITSPPIPVDGQGSIDLYWSETRDSADNSIIPATSGGVPNVTINWGTYFELLQVWGDGTQFQETDAITYRATNTNTGNSAVVALKSIIGDGPNPSVRSALQTFDGADWAASSLWGEGVSGSRTKKLLELLAATIVSTQLTPRVKYVGQLITTDSRDVFHAYSRLKINRKYYIFLGGTFEANQDTWTNINLFHIASDTSIVAPDIPTEDSPSGTPEQSE